MTKSQLGSTINESDFIFDSSNVRRYRATCNGCGKDRGYVRKTARHKMCMSCGQKGKKSPLKGRKSSLQTIQKLKDEQTRRLAIKNLRKRTEEEKRLIHTLRSRLWQSIRGLKTSSSTLDLIGCSTENLKKYLESKFLPGMSWDNYGRGPGKWQIDHIKRLASFNLLDLEEQRRANSYLNLQPIWYEDHLEKTIRENSYI